MSKLKYSFSLVFVLAFLSLFGTDAFGQCGVHFRRASTWSFPISRVHLNFGTDMNGDGLPDLVLSEETQGSWTRQRIIIVPNLGNGSFGSPWATLIPPAGEQFNYTFFPVRANNDNLPDLVISLADTGGPNTFRLHINNGNGTFSPGPTTSVSISRSFFDVNNDGNIDLLGQEEFSAPLRYFPGNGAGGFGAPITILDHGSTASEFNGDGKTDFVDRDHLHLNNGDGTWGTINISATMNSSDIMSIADFNLDGKFDLQTSGPPNTTRVFGILISTGTGFTRTDHTLAVDPSWIGSLWVRNWVGNNAPDVVFQPYTVAQKLVLTNDGTGNFTQQLHNGRIDIVTGQESAYADFDNDGKTDRVRATSDISNSRIMLKDVTSFTFEKQVCDQPGQPRVVDYDRSNSTDWSFWNPATGDWSRRTLTNGQGPPPTDETVNWGLGSFGDIPTPGDFDGDGITDRAVYRNSTGYWYVRRSSDLGWFVFKFGLTGDKPVVADYDGDTISDIAVWRPSEGNWYIWLMGPQQFTAAHFGSDGDKPAPADFDGDLKTDLAVYRPSTGVWYYLKSSDGNYVVVPWGISTDRPMPADFDGDGKADINVHRASENMMYILRSSTGTPTYYQWGVAGDFIQIGDYDGDYVADLGVYRPSNKSWWTTTIPPWGLIVYGADGVLPTSSLIRSE